MVSRSNLSDFEKLLDKYDYSFKKGDLVKGIICSVEKQGLWVDIGAKSSAFVPVFEAIDNNEDIFKIYNIGSNLEFLIISEENDDGQFILSKKKVDFAYSWKELEKLKEVDKTIIGKIVNIVKGGILVKVLGINGFVPSSQLRLQNPDLEIGKEIDLKILSIDSEQNNLILSNKKVYEAIIREQRQSIFNEIEVGQVIKGKIVSITEFGAFVDIGGVDGLLPLSQLSWKWVDHPTDIINIGDIIETEVIEVDYEQQRVSLSLKNLEEDPWLKVSDTCKEGDKVEGKITRIKNYGVFVEILSGIEALLPHNEVIEVQNNLNTILQVGNLVTAYIVKFNIDDKRILLSTIKPNIE